MAIIIFFIPLGV